MNEVSRGNRLAYAPSAHFEYLIHGLFKRTEDDTNGIHGAWWVPLKKLLKEYGEEDLKPILEAFEAEQVEERAQALANLALEDDDEDGEGAAEFHVRGVRIA